MPYPDGQNDVSGGAPSQGAGGDPVGFDDLWKPTDSGGLPRGPERILLDSGKITDEHVEHAVKQQQDCPQFSILELLVQSGVIDELTSLKAVAEYFNLPFARINPDEVDDDVAGLLPTDYIKEKHVVPIRQTDEGFVVGITDPADIFLIDDIKRRLRSKVQLVVIPPADILKVMEETASSPSQKVEEIIQDINEDDVEVVDDEEEDVTDLEKIAGESPVIRYVNYLIASAVKEDASDIHIEPTEKRLRVRLRIDGVLFEQNAPPLKMHAAIISRLKIMANLDIAERRLPQDGRIRATVHGRTVDLRLSTLPVVHGEKCVIRILDDRSILVGLENLGMGTDHLENFRKAILQPHGIVLVTGPTGSGKSTTLYSALQVMDSDHLNISTVEDPVEYELASINQVHVHESIGMSFAAALRSLLRQDPDVVMVGEIRDEQTARIAIQASLTGHLVLSTLHTNDAPSSITRLINIGIEPYLISASVNAVLAQRLVRRICQNCKTRVTEVKESVAAYLDKYGASSEELYYGTGCDKCRQTGFKGRVGIYELLLIDDEMRDIITANPALGELRRFAREHGMIGLRDDGLRKIEAGLTTAEEVMRVTET
ncbi:MAG: GspE/PulE family protein [Phycisphaerae bacterium]